MSNHYSGLSLLSILKCRKSYKIKVGSEAEGTRRLVQQSQQCLSISRRQQLDETSLYNPTVRGDVYQHDTLLYFLAAVCSVTRMILVQNSKSDCLFICRAGSRGNCSDTLLKISVFQGNRFLQISDCRKDTLRSTFHYNSVLTFYLRSFMIAVSFCMNVLWLYTIKYLYN